jgi:Tfp pilus assembly protein PilF
VPARFLVFAFAVLLAGFALIERHDTRTCLAQGASLLREVLDATDIRRDQLVDEFRDRCDGSHRLAFAASGLAAEGLTRHAVVLADEAIRREPRNYEGWAALAAALRRQGLDGAADRALREVRRLNPRFGQAPG